ncbi:helix-turn-helix transcriptional regulator [Amycolatopsis sp. NBC_01480]|uniref:helix-turn-helix transcriptional regulator n=1 Tax=Amycolatopsis sp. NBC_01480 TaxID=2903562 RepID=UPI002E29EB9E|nr:WYL domain-containing protein [Amycolatopsis sp. NBC_01480]
MRASRLVSALLLLQARGRLTAGQLAQELEVSVRTVYRDMESLAAAGIPLYGEAGHDGGYQLVEGYRTRLTGLTAGEAEALFLAGLPDAAADLGLGGVRATGRLKLLAALPEGLRERAGHVQARFHLDTAGWYAQREAVPHLAAVVEATWQGRLLRLRYRRWAEPREVVRTVEPYGVVLKAGSWYLVAGVGGAARTYRVSQIEAAEVLDAGFSRPESFVLEQHWAAYLADFEARRLRAEAVLRLSPEVFANIADLLEPVQAAAARETAVPEPGGWVRVVVPIESVDHAARGFLGLGEGAEVVSPPELRDRMAGIVETLAAVYGRSMARV